MKTRISQHGFGAIAAIMILVFMGALAAAMLRLATSQQTGSAQDVLSARANQSARAGVEWMLRQAVVLGNCSSVSGSTLDLSSTSGFWVKVTCVQTTYNEGESSEGVAQQRNVYTIDATACNSSTCPASGATAASPTYIERARQVIATD